MEMTRAYAYRYAHGDIIVYGEDKHGIDMNTRFMMYDSLADVKRKLRADGVKNVSHMRKWAW